MSYTFLIPSENSISSLAQGEESSVECFSDIPASVLSRSSLTAAKSCSNGNGMESCPAFPSGMTSEPSMESHFGEWWMLSAVAFRARTSASVALERELKESGADYGRKWCESFAMFDPFMSLWKTAQPSLFEELDEFSGIWPRWGIMQGGECFHASRQAEFTYGSESGLRLPTTGANEYKGSSSKRFIGSPDFRGAKMSEGLRICERDPIYLNPCFAELVMMWPMGWTDLKPLGMDKFQEWLHSHGESFMEPNNL